MQSVSELVGMEGDTPQLQEIFRFVSGGKANRRITGDFLATGVVPRLVQRLRENHIDVPMQLFQAKPRSAGSEHRGGEHRDEIDREGNPAERDLRW